ncbi:MAG TPA: glycosyltransferase [Acidimicrobiales bacterium]|nr:glycosyltransferase [Acidimicrobiales bacterium]
MIFLTVGSRYGFDRLVRAVDDMVDRGEIHEDVTAQIGLGSYVPRHMHYERFMEASHYDARMRDAHMLIGHAGSGTITHAVSNCKPLLVMPRLKRFHEHVNDHQVATARKFEELHHVLAADGTADLPRRFAELPSFIPARRVARTDELAGRIGEFLRSIK